MAGNGGFQASSGYNDRPPSSTGSGEADLAVDPASSSFFNNEFKRHEDLKIMLDSNKDSQKLDAMKRIIGMVAKGKDASDLFPAVVKNVVSKNLEVKKLVYVYLTSIDPEQKDQLVEVIEKLLGDKTTLVAGSAIQAFEEVCPERIDLIHKNYRKLLNLLVDVEEWGQVVIINMLTRYARTQFVNPNQGDTVDDTEKPFYESEKDEDDENEDDENEEDEAKPKAKPYIMDQDHRLLLRQSKPLLNSRNAAVVMGVAQLYHHCAPRGEVGLVAKSLIRLLRSHPNIATMSIKQRGMFEPYLKSFYVRSNDPTHTYVTSADKEFAAATIQAIGRCASNIAEVTDTCLNGLVLLMSNRDEGVVAESVVVIKKLLQMQTSTHKDIIIHMARMVDNITVPMARASILWLIGEYSDRVPKIAPDVLRKMAKTFIQEEDIVKLQILNLGAKLMITNSKQTKLLCQYVFNLAKYDQNYDIRDRSRFLRQLVLPSGEKGVLSKHAKKIFLSTKPAPVLESKFKDCDQYQLGTLSHMINSRATGYQQLPEWPEHAPDPSVRNVEVVMPWTEKTPLRKDKKGKPKPEKSFYSSSESSSPDDDSSDDDSDSEEGSEDESDSETDSDKEKTESEDSEEDSSASEDTDSDSDAQPTPKKKPSKPAPVVKKDESISGSDDSSEEDSSDETSSESEPEVKRKGKQFTPQITGKSYELLNKLTGNGLSITYRFTRTISIFSPKMVSIELAFTNSSDNTLSGIKIGQKLPWPLRTPPQC
ncbi:AP3B2-like protein [Mya arenaria]|uniref:AP3B2-like protein n=1 Tax=Mya arenaria TaxID=6604 RepID=A0ABY7ETI1_MYAAR|nr:AP3B2-like protein [Mya arenaria]